MNPCQKPTAVALNGFGQNPGLIHAFGFAAHVERSVKMHPGEIFLPVLHNAAEIGLQSHNLRLIILSAAFAQLMRNRAEHFIRTEIRQRGARTGPGTPAGIRFTRNNPKSKRMI